MGIFIHGLACPFNQKSTPRQRGDLRFFPGAFRHLLHKPIGFQLSHNKVDIPTLEQRLTEKHDGLYFSCLIDSGSELSALLASGIQHGILRGFSVGIVHSPSQQKTRGVFNIHKCHELREISLSMSPSMPGTWVRVGADPSVKSYSFEETRYLLLSVLRQDFREPAPPKEPPALMPVPSPEIDRELLEVQRLHPGRRVRRAPAGANYAWLVSGGSMLAAAR